MLHDRRLLNVPLLGMLLVMLTAATAQNVVTVTSTDDGGTGSLRDAIDAANQTANTTIKFAIPNADSGYDAGTGVYTIRPSTALPPITASGLLIDGVSQRLAVGDTNPLGPEIRLDGGMLSSGSGLVFAGATGCTVRGLVVTDWPTSGIEIQGSTDQITVSGCYIGVKGDGLTASGNGLRGAGLAGIYVRDGAGAVSIDGSVSRNVISGNARGIACFGGNTLRLVGNYIGTDRTGTTAVANSGQGVFLTGTFQSITIGDVNTGEGNVVSGNGSSGVSLDTVTGPVTIQNNTIGLDAAGSVALGNTLYGIAAAAVSQLRVGGPSLAQRNVASSNGAHGLYLRGCSGAVVQSNYFGLDRTGTLARGNGTGGGVLVRDSSNCVIGGSATLAGQPPGNVIAGNNPHGVDVIGSTSSGNSLRGNLIGTNAAGDAALTGQQTGIYIVGAIGTVIGGGTSGDGNVLAGHTDSGIWLGPSAAFELGAPVSTEIYGNRIGLARDGNAKLNNTTGNGVALYDGCQNTVIGGAGSQRNLIGDNRRGVLLQTNAGGSAVTGTKILGNWIGVNAAGAAVRNLIGVYITGGCLDTAIGEAGAGNLISSNGRGIGIFAPADFSVGHTIAANWIGTSTNGLSALPNDDGVNLSGNVSGVTIGGPSEADGNLISGNGGPGIQLGSGVTDTMVLGNVIGLGTDRSTLLGNVGAGLEIDGAVGTTIGGPATGGLGTAPGNLISGNAQFGVFAQNSGDLYLYGNLIGTNGEGSLARGNVGTGVSLNGGTGTVTVGGSTAAEGNLISGNTFDGLRLTDLAGPQVQGNAVGVNLAGTSALPNGGDGIRIERSDAPTLVDNLVSGNAGHGVVLYGDTTPTQYAEVYGNRIGVDRNGASAVPNGQSGLRLEGNVQYGLIGYSGTELNLISGNGASGVDLWGPSTAAQPQHNCLVGNRIGTNLAGNAALPNQNHGIWAHGYANDNIIGGYEQSAGNLISGNLGSGVRLDGSGVVANQIMGCYIGLGLDGTRPLPNGDHGIYVLDAVGNNIGAEPVDSNPTHAPANLIGGHSADGLAGILLSGTACRGNWIDTNTIGLGADGSTKVPNYLGLAVINGAHDNFVGTQSSTPGLVSGNLSAGLLLDNAQNNRVSHLTIGLDLNDAAAPNAGGVVISGGSTSNELLESSIAGNAGSGILLTGSTTSGNTIAGCAVGVAPDRATARPNSIGVLLTGATHHNLIGDLNQGLENLISGNTGAGIELRGANDNLVQDNLLGCDETTQTVVPNAAGVVIGSGSQRNTLARNTIVGHQTGVALRETGTSANQLVGNCIGLNQSGEPLPNVDGVVISAGATQNKIGGDPDAPNYLTSNSRHGVWLTGAGTDQNVVVDNQIGVTPLGSAPGNGGYGVVVSSGAAENVIGGARTNGVEVNTISGNQLSGVGLFGAGTIHNRVSGNLIGQVPGLPGTGNANHGVEIGQGASQNFVGELAPDNENELVGNVVNGIRLQSDAGNGNAFFQNRIHDNGQLEIDLNGDGVTANDAGDPDSGPNRLLNFPELTAAWTDGTDTYVAGTFGSATTNVRYPVLIELFKTDSPDSSGHGGALEYLGTTLVNGPGAVNASVAHDLNGYYLTTIATDSEGNSSEFSGNLEVATSPANTVPVVNLDDSGVGSLRGAIEYANLHAATVITFHLDAALATGGVFRIQPLSALPPITGEGTFLDGASQTDYTGDTNPAGPEIVLDGSRLTGPPLIGLTVSGSLCDVGQLVIQNFADAGIAITGAAATSDAVFECYVGTDPTGLVAAPNGQGIRIDGGAADARIGGGAGREGNLISGNTGRGIFATGTGTNSVVVMGNLIGVKADQSGPLGNQAGGIELAGVPNCQLGGAAGLDVNVIAGNRQYGVRLSGSGTTGCILSSNQLGAADSQTFGNGAYGIWINGAQGNYIGSPAPEDANLITGSEVGVRVEGAGARSNFLGANEIFGNSVLGIDLVAPGDDATLVTRNDPGDTDTGPHDLLNFPVLLTAELSGDRSTIDLRGFVGARSIIQVFQANPHDFGQGAKLLFGGGEGSAADTDTGTGSYSGLVNGLAQGSDSNVARFRFSIPNTLELGTGEFLTATASNSAGTSEFSGNVKLTGAPQDLGFLVQPSNTAVGQPIIPPVQVEVLDVDGQRATSDNRTAVTISLSDDPNAPVAPTNLSGTLTRTASNGVATFDDLRLDRAGSGFVLQAGAALLSPTDSQPFDVVLPGAAKLAFLQQPTNIRAGAAIGPAVTVEIRDAADQRVTTAAVDVTVELEANPTGDTLGGTLTVTSVNGLATFDDLALTAAGTGYQLAAAANGLAGAVSGKFNVNSGPPSTVDSLVEATPDTARADGKASIKATVTVLDSYGNPVVGLAAGKVVVAADPALGVLVTQPAKATDANGQTSALVTSTTPAEVSLSARVDGALLDSTADVRFLPRLPAADKSTVSILPGKVAADGQDTATLTVVLRDAAGAPVVGSSESDRELTVTGPAGAAASEDHGWAVDSGATTGREGLFTAGVSLDAPGTYTIQVVVDGVALEAVQLVGRPYVEVLLEPGQQMLGLALQPDPECITRLLADGVRGARWDAAQARYQAVAPTDFATGGPLVKRGWWIDHPLGGLVAVYGEPLAGPPVAVPLDQGWTQVPNPFQGGLLWDLPQIQVAVDGSLVGTLAQTDLWTSTVRPYGWQYLAAEQRYDLIFDPSRAGFESVNNVVDENGALWVRSFVTGAELRFPAALLETRARRSASRAARRADSVSAHDWQVNFTAGSVNGSDPINRVGLVSDLTRALVLEDPPPAGDPSDVEFSVLSDGRAAAGELRPWSGSDQVWDATVLSRSGSEVTLSWPSLLRDLPRGVVLELTDQQTGRTVLLNTHGSYQYAPTRAGEERKFQISSRYGRLGRSEVTGMVATPTRGRSVAVTLTLTGPGEVTLTIRGLGGRLVKRLSATADAAGNLSLGWDGTDEQGRKVPAGTYLVEAAVTAQNGALSRTTRTVRVP